MTYSKELSDGMEAYLRDSQLITDAISGLMDSSTLSQSKEHVSSLIKFSEENQRLRKRLFTSLLDAVILCGKQFFAPRPHMKRNVVFVPPDAAPVLMILTCVQVSEDEDAVLSGLNRYVARCDEFSDPMEDAATEEEMCAVLDSAQKKYRVLDIIAPVRPLKIVSLSNSHCVHNCECGITDDVNNEAMIFVFHPRDVVVFDRVFIFAHELGHALHLALTGDVDLIPDSFDDFNDKLGVKGLSVREKQECFADAVAIAILNSKGLREHLPVDLPKALLPYFDRYVSSITGGGRLCSVANKQA